MKTKPAQFQPIGRGALAPTTAKNIKTSSDGYILFSVATNVVRVEVSTTPVVSATATTGLLYQKDNHYRIDLRAGTTVSFIDTVAGASAVYYTLFG
jgi:hypothetical protein